jgi:hypothetical protein
MHPLMVKLDYLLRHVLNHECVDVDACLNVFMHVRVCFLCMVRMCAYMHLHKYVYVHAHRSHPHTCIHTPIHTHVKCDTHSLYSMCPDNLIT